MTRNKILCVLGGILIITLLISTVSVPAKAQDPSSDGVALTYSEATMGAPEQLVTVDSSTPPVLTEQQAANIKWGEEHTHLAPPVETGAAISAVAGPVAGTETTVVEARPRSGQPLAPSDLTAFIWNTFGGSIPGGYKSNIMEMSTAGKAFRIFATGNWWAARSLNKGVNWTFLDPYAAYPSFCCDQVTLHDGTRDLYIWLQMGVPGINPSTGNYENSFKLNLDGMSPFAAGYWSYTFTPVTTNGGWTNQWWDYPQMQLGANYLYISWNMFDINSNWTRTLMLRLPLDALAAAAGFSYSYYDQSSWFTFVPVSGADHAMYFASNWASPYNSLFIVRWDEIDNGLVGWIRTVPTFSLATPVCGSPNWLGRADFRLLTGARYDVNNNGFSDSKIYGRKVLGWWWNVAAGGGFGAPYIEGAAFYEDTVTLLPGYIGRPYMYGSACFAYPSMAPNNRGDLGTVFNWSTSSLGYEKPLVGIGIADDFVSAPPGWVIYGQAASSAGSTGYWGDYNTVRAYQVGTTWIAGSHFIYPSTSNCNNCSVPLWMGFGRERDRVNFSWW